MTILLFWEWPHLISHKSFILLLLVTHLISCQCFKHSPKSSSVRRRRRSRQERKSNIYRKCRLEHEQSLLHHLPPPKGRTTYKNWITTPTQEDTSSVALNLYTFECMMSFLAFGRVTLMLCTFTVIWKSIPTIRSIVIPPPPLSIDFFYPGDYEKWFCWPKYRPRGPRRHEERNGPMSMCDDEESHSNFLIRNNKWSIKVYSCLFYRLSRTHKNSIDGPGLMEFTQNLST